MGKIDETGGHDVEWNKPDTRREILPVLSHIWKLKKGSVTVQ
jgi:hypothetical protein